ncbi:hypothetical protein Tco_1018542 [Tanacetum coccineum]|uniref:Uncharacterized protein n=1 Tax=Tanacetum coccineum TaxID=301880 RepID=A0ABQ5FWM4_9ASTR
MNCVCGKDGSECGFLSNHRTFSLAAPLYLCWLILRSYGSMAFKQFWVPTSLQVINGYITFAQGAGKKILILKQPSRRPTLDDENGVAAFTKQVIWGHAQRIGRGHISNGTPFLMYPRFVQLFLNKQLEGVDRPQDFIPSVSLPSKVFTFMRKHSTKFSCRITPLTPSMLEVVSALAAEEEQSTSPHSRAASSARVAQGTPITKCLLNLKVYASVQGTASFQGTATSQGTAAIQRTADFQGTAEPHDAASIPKSPNDYTPTDESQTSGGDEGLLDIYALNREVRRLKKQTLSQAKTNIKAQSPAQEVSKVGSAMMKELCSEVATNVQRRKTQNPFLIDIVIQMLLLLLIWKEKVMGAEELILKRKKALNVKMWETEELDLETIKTKRFEHFLVPYKTQLNRQTQGTDTQNRERKGMLKEREGKKTLKEKEATISEEQPAKKPKQDLYHLYRVVDDYYEHIPPTGLGLALLGDLNIIWETAESSDDDFWKIRRLIMAWKLKMRLGQPSFCSSVHLVETEDGEIFNNCSSWIIPFLRHVAEKNNLFGAKTTTFEEVCMFKIRGFISRCSNRLCTRYCSKDED